MLSGCGSESSERGQAFTLEAVLASLIVVAGLAFALQAVTVTPSTSGSNAEPVEAAQLDSVLLDAAQSDALKRAVLAWDGGFEGVLSGEDYFVGEFPGNEFGTALDEAVGPSVAVNVAVRYPTGPDTMERQRMVYNGLPGDGAVRAATTVSVYDDDRLYDAGGDPRGGTSVASDGLYDGFGDRSSSGLYGVLTVEVVAWRA